MQAAIFTSVKDFFFTSMPYMELTWGAFLGSIAILFFSYALRFYIVEGFLLLAGKLAKKTKTEVDDLLLEVIRIPLRTTVIYFGILAAIWILPLNKYPTFEWFIFILFRLGAIIIVAWTAIRSLVVLAYLMKRITKKTDTLLDDKLIPFIDQMLRILIIVITIVMILQELGYDPSGLLAGLGLGGLAFALAAKDTLSNFFGSIMLLTDKPFHVDEWIKFEEVEGTVEQIGFRSTKVRLFDKSLVQVPNGKLASGNIRNFNRRDRRRIYFNIGITYQCTPIMMKAALETVKRLIKENDGIRDDFYLVNFNSFGDSALKIMVYCFTTSTVWGEYLHTQESLMLQVMNEFKKLDIEFAYPSMTVHMAPDTPQGIEEKSKALLDKLSAEATKDSSYSMSTTEPVNIDDGGDGGGGEG
jgi:MscS family membrane protein